jgi:phosphoribosyl-ATP pyrophosphohydrolase
MNNIYQKVIDNYGKKHQIKKAIEELQELKLELLRALNNRMNKKRIISEMADVHNVLVELRLIFGINCKDVENEMVYKMNRTLEIIENETNAKQV